MQASKFKRHNAVVILITFLFFGFKSEKISPKLQEKIDSAIQGTFEVEEFTMERIEVPSDLNKQTPSEMGGENLFKITSLGKELGYIYVGVAPSLKKTFDYVVLLNPDLNIKKSKILIYREDHGRQVGSQRWLKQFIGRKSGEKLVYGEDIDGISGATVSAKSMTLAVSNVLESLQVLKNANVF
ncbi:FMN-binding protein [Muricauda brasiliensis]|uniref:FMN-binding protein n=1 Tax=Muricauda brasiliensis TaxID=2162892 RepID=UPI00131EFF08|nr:FMN-binding protein [Muricauda brasiliensis]